MYFSIFDLNSTDDYRYLLDTIGQDITLNGQPIRAIITNTNLEQNYGDYKISSLSPLPRGGVIEYNGNKYMIISEQPDMRYNKYKATMRRLPHTIIVNSSCRFYALDCYITTSNLDVSEGRILSLPDGKIYVYYSNIYQELELKIGDRFLLDSFAFKIVGIDTWSKSGMVILSCDKDEINSALDDVDNNIAGLFACSVTVTNPQPIEVYEGDTLQLTWESNNAPVVFESSDESIARVDDNGGVTGVSIGEVQITASNATYPILKDTITVNVVEAPSAYTIVITSAFSLPNEIKYNQSKTYYAEVYNGTTPVTGESVTFELFADDQISSTTLATTASQDGSSCTVKNNGANSGYVQLKCTLQSDSSVFTWFRIQMKPLY